MIRILPALLGLAAMVFSAIVAFQELAYLGREIGQVLFLLAAAVFTCAAGVVVLAVKTQRED